ncbi:MAG: hypothetical protein HGJ93_19050 [Desulfosarcina sp.]|nr:hypothetical protein [Desulfosarcina sp.]MBC2767964.1 hypothetical protein [Desulfosarcina sp.]
MNLLHPEFVPQAEVASKIGLLCQAIDLAGYLPGQLPCLHIFKSIYSHAFSIIG